MSLFAGIDLGGTYIRAVVGEESGRQRGREKRETPPGPTGAAVTEATGEALRAACTDAGVDPSALEAVGIGSVGPLDLDAGTVENPANLPDTIETIELVGPIAALAATDAVFLHNDAVAGVIGERFYGEATPENMVYLTISTGIGAGIITDGNVLGGRDGNAGEVGHMTLDPDGAMPCGCGRDGHWEAYTSGDNIPRHAAAFYRAGEWETDIPVTEASFTAAELFTYAGEDAFADAFIDRLATFNAMGVANVVQAYAPEVIAMGGAVAENNPDLVVGKIRERLPELVFGMVPDIEITTLGDDVVVKGALASALTGGTGDREPLRE